MERNVAVWDRVLRVIVGLAIVSLVLVGPKSPWALLGLVPLVTGLFGSCPVYLALGITTCRAKVGGPPRIFRSIT
jgi:hypothetical protein